MRLTDFKALTFDCYGTLIDWERGITAALTPLVERAGKPLTRDEVLEAHARHESQQQRYTPEMPYSDLLAVVFRRLAEEWGVHATANEAAAYGQSVKQWPAFPDSASTLQYLKKYFKLVVLSNVDNESFAHSNAKLEVEFDAVITAEDVGSYKPARRNFEYMIDLLPSLGVRRDEVLHVADSHFHDHQPCSELRLRSCWIYRRFEQRGFGATVGTVGEPAVEFKWTSMAQLVKAHHEELSKG
ncbi:haloacid dehalogenase type II [Paraburkholderia bryophila]|uniref:haloacid dehalogenase type II n=1 Tax=Paraburkholderia bryophila TaxID=420952 RepID=UPI00234A038B|nr:haloacid dehalogenase type II [Paraburkholderia bryophila]WCM23019.1 haloacid dehalogenase type II [Paraburkholderia bryophila]